MGFVSKVTGDIVNSSRQHNVAKDVSNECRGLPLALAKLGRALKHKRQLHGLRRLMN